MRKQKKYPFALPAPAKILGGPGSLSKGEMVRGSTGSPRTVSQPDWHSQVTLFQRKVYEVLLRIPKGEVRTYQQVARIIGQPKAARAVGQALKRNRWAPQIPCHRVVASNGLGGYSARGGLSAKRRLLRREGVELARRYST